MIFQWDLAKDRANQKKHSVSFREAKELLSSEADFLEIFDDSHSADEERFIVHRGVIVVVWTERTEETIRIISARFATKKEKQLYREYMEKR
jgi:uncharacterized DUF497 family protein